MMTGRNIQGDGVLSLRTQYDTQPTNYVTVNLIGDL